MFSRLRLSPPTNNRRRSAKPSLKRLESPVTSPQDPEPARRRKAAPANVPLPRTLDWAEDLPSSVKPTALLRQYARIANVLAATWDDPKALSPYMDGLLRDNRGNRKGFPPDILSELLALREQVAQPGACARAARRIMDVLEGRCAKAA